MDFNTINSSKEVVRAACKKCGYAGHLTYQCRNFQKVHFLSQIAHFINFHQLYWLPHCRWTQTKKSCWTSAVPAAIRTQRTWRHWPSYAKRSCKWKNSRLPKSTEKARRRRRVKRKRSTKRKRSQKRKRSDESKRKLAWFFLLYDYFNHFLFSGQVVRKRTIQMTVTLLIPSMNVSEKSHRRNRLRKVKNRKRKEIQIRVQIEFQV